MLAAGNLMGGQRRHRPAAAEADRPDRHPRLQRGQRLRHRRHRAAHGDHGDQGGRGRHGPGRRRREAGRRRPARRRRRRKDDADTWTPDGPLRRGRRRSTAASAPRPCRACSPRSAWSTATSYGGTSFELFAKISEKNHAHSTLNPLAAYTKRITLEQIMGDVMIAYPNTRPMCSANCDGAAAAVVVSATPSSRRCPSSSSAGRSRSRRRCSPPTRGRRRARSCPTSTP